MRTTFFAILMAAFFYAAPVTAASDLSAEHIARLSAVKSLLGDADARTLSETINDLKKSPAIEEELQLREAVAKTFQTLVDKYQLTGREARARLLDKIRMNMAYFQLGGPDAEGPSQGGLNMAIRRELKKHLTPDLRSDPRFFKNLDE